MRREAAIYRSPAQKFERQVEEDELRAAEHRVRTSCQAGSYRAVCSCAWRGPWRSTWAEADVDAQDHRA